MEARRWDLHDDVELLPLALGIQERIVSSLDPEDDFETVSDSHIRLCVLGRKVDPTIAVRHVQVGVKVPGSRRVEERRGGVVDVGTSFESGDGVGGERGDGDGVGCVRGDGQ